MKTELVSRRLSLIKFLFIQGTELSKRSGLVAGFSILSFHDAVEMFLKLVAEKKNIKSQQKFTQYFEKIPELTLQEPMSTLNKMRVNLKHHGIMPDKEGVSECRMICKEFFEENCPGFFNVEFGKISLLDLLKFKKAKEYLEQSQNQLNEGNFRDSIKYSAFAFDELIEEYKSNKMGFYRNDPFKVADSLSSPLGHPRLSDKPLSKEFQEFTRDINTRFEAIDKMLQINALGLDYKQYIKFDILTPRRYRTANDSFVASENEQVNSTFENAEFCFNYVIESGITIQQVDFELRDLKRE